MADLIREKDWSRTPLGPMEEWPAQLKTSVGIMLGAKDPIGIYWGSDCILLYNDAWRLLIGDKHPSALGRPAPEVFPEIWEAISPMFASILATGQAVRQKRQLLPLNRGETIEDAWFDYSANPIPAEDGTTAGVFNIAIEITSTVLAERAREREIAERKRVSEALRDREERLDLMLELSDALRPLVDTAEIQGEAARLLGAWLGASRTYYLDYEAEAGYGTVARDYVVDGSPTLVGRYDHETFQTVYARIGEGRTWTVADVTADRELAPEERDILASQGVVAWIDVPLLKKGELVAILCVTQTAARAWTDAEVALVEDVAERTWAAVERARAETALRESQGRYRTLFDSIDEGFCVVDVIFDEAGEPADYVFVEVNRAFEGQTGLVGAVGKRMRLLAPEHEEFWFETYGRVALTGEPERFEHCAEALHRWYRVYAFRVGAPEDHRVAILFDDATARHRVEQALRESEEKYRSLFDSIDEGLAIVEMIYDDHGNIVDMIFRQVNAAYERQGGIYNVVGRSVSEMLPGVEDIWLDRYKQVARTGQPIRIEDYQQDVDRWFDVYFSRVDKGGRFVAIVFNDISERKRADAELRASEERKAFLLKLSDALRAEPDADAVAERAIRMLSEQMQLDRCYIASYRLTDDRADITHQVGNVGVPVMPDTIKLSDFPAAFRQVFGQTLVIDDVAETKGLSETDRRNIEALGLRALIAPTLRKGENSPLWVIVAVSARPRQWSQGEIALAEEATERTWAAMERARAEAALREASQAKSQFLATMSHELRTPLQGVIGFADLLETEVNGPMTAKQQRSLARIKASAWHLVGIIEEILTLSRAEAGKEEVHREEVDVAAIAREVADIIESQAASHGLRLQLEGAEERAIVQTDGGKVRQILVNLIGNAVKYTQEGTITVRVDRSDAEWFEVHIRDTGTGIAPEDQERVFEPFTQVDSALTRTGSGTGLGLAICRRLARLMGGEISLQSTLDEGSTFTLRLPRE